MWFTYHAAAKRNGDGFFRETPAHALAMYLASRSLLSRSISNWVVQSHNWATSRFVSMQTSAVEVCVQLLLAKCPWQGIAAHHVGWVSAMGGRGSREKGRRIEGHTHTHTHIYIYIHTHTHTHIAPGGGYTRQAMELAQR